MLLHYFNPTIHMVTKKNDFTVTNFRTNSLYFFDLGISSSIYGTLGALSCCCTLEIGRFNLTGFGFGTCLKAYQWLREFAKCQRNIKLRGIVISVSDVSISVSAGSSNVCPSCSFKKNSPWSSRIGHWIESMLTLKVFDYVFTKNSPKLSFLIQVPIYFLKTFLDTCNRRIL